jgi:hypothetical protein
MGVVRVDVGILIRAENMSRETGLSFPDCIDILMSTKPPNETDRADVLPHESGPGGARPLQRSNS